MINPRTQVPYLLWKTNNLIFWPSKIWMRKLHQDGLSFDEKSEAIPILSAYLFHELHCVEGPWMLYRQVDILFKYDCINVLKE